MYIILSVHSTVSHYRYEGADTGKGITGEEGAHLAGIIRPDSSVVLSSPRRNMVTFGPVATSKHPWTFRKDGGRVERVVFLSN